MEKFLEKRMQINRGAGYEKSLSPEIYTQGSYGGREQIFTYAHQVSDIIETGARDILEIGVGAGITAGILRKLGFSVTTCDINENLKPDINCPIESLPSIVPPGSFELVVCCEVLEHIPFENFDSIIEGISRIGNSLYLTLPVSHYYFGYGGLLRIPKICRPFSFYLKFPVKRKLINEHFWEIGSSTETAHEMIMGVLRKYYPRVTSRHSTINPYHKIFICSR